MIIKPIEPQHYRITQAFWENFKWNIWGVTKYMYWPWGWIPAWQYHLWIDFTSRENKWGTAKPLPIRAWVDWEAKFIQHTWKGNLVEITWKDYFIEYMHLDSFEWPSRIVKAWEIIWYTWNTGTYSTAPHLHMGVKRVKNGKIVSWTNYGFIDFLDILKDAPILPERNFKQLRVWRGCKVRQIDYITWSNWEIAINASAGYNVEKDTIVLTPKFFTFDIDHQEWVLDHETGHRLWELRLSDEEKKSWTEVSELSFRVRYKLAKKWKLFYQNAYVNDYAKTKVTEDFWETIEDCIRYPDKEYWDYRDVKRHVAMRIFERNL